MRTRTPFIYVLIGSLILASSLTVSSPAFGTINSRSIPGLPSNPDDYHVEKYRALLQEARQIEQQAERNLEKKQSALRETEEQIQIATSKIRELEGTIQDLSRQIDQSQTAIRANEARVAELNQELARLPGQIQENERLVTQLETRVTQLSQKLSRAQESLREREQLLESKRELLRQAQSSLTVAQSQAKEASDRLSQLEGRAQQSRLSIEKAKSEQAEAESRIASINIALRQTEEKIQGIEKDLENTRLRASEADQVASAMERRATQAEQSGAPNASELRKKAIELRKFAKEAADRVTQLERSLSLARETLSRQRKVLELAQQQRAAAIEAEQSAQRELSLALQDLPAARKAIEESQQRLSVAAEKARQANLEFEAARSFASEGREAVNLAERDLQQARTQLAQANTRLSDLQGKRTQILAQISSLNQDSTQQAQQIRAARERREEFVRSRDQQERLLSGFRSELQVRLRERNEAQAYHSQTRELLEQRSRRLAIVEDNLRKGIEFARQMGLSEGAQDGYRIGQRDGYERGVREGQDRGEQEGRRQGTDQGVSQARARGVSDGQAQGVREGIQRGTQDGEAKGLREGSQNGQTEGLLAGFEAGRKEGTPVGLSAGTQAGQAAGGFSKGKTEGIAQGTTLAQIEAQKQGTPMGYQKGEKEFLSAPLREIVLPESSSPRSFWRNFNHPHAPRTLHTSDRERFPHPEMERVYEETYRNAYSREAASAYEQSYRETYQRSYDSAYRDAFIRYSQADYPIDYRSAYEAAYNQAYIRSYRENIDRAYGPAYQSAYQTAFQAAFPQRKAEGYKAGYDEGFTRGREEAYAADFQRGKKEGEEEGYAKTFPLAYKEAETAGYLKANQFYSENSVIAPVTAAVLDRNNDQIFAPGEPLLFHGILKNFGRKESGTNLSLVATEWSAGIQVSASSVNTPSIPAQSETTFKARSEISISPTAPLGSNQFVKFQLVSKTSDSTARTKVLGSFQSQFSVNFPYSFSGEETPDYATPDEDLTVRLTVSNISSRGSQNTVKLNLVSRTPGVEIRIPTQDLGKIPSGGGSTATFGVRINSGSEFQKVELEATLLEDGTVVGRRKIQFDSTRRWTFNPGASGLLIVNQTKIAKNAMQALRSAGLEVDFWDSRIEGMLTPEKILQYSSNQILFIPELNRDLDGSLGPAVRAFLNRGGTVFTLSDANSALFRELESEGRRLKFEEYQGLQMAFSNSFDSVQKRIFFAPSSATQSVELLREYLSISSVFSQKIQIQLSSLIREVPGARDAVIRTLLREMEDDKEVDGKNYKEQRETLSLSAYVTTTLSYPVGSLERNALLSLYPALNTARKDIGWVLSPRRLQIRKILKPIKKAYLSELKN